MARSTSRYPTETELAILKVLWSLGPCTAHQVQQALGGKPRAFNTVMTLLTIMARKRYVRRRKTSDGHLFTACITERDTGRGMLGDLVQRLFSGSALTAMLQLLDTRELDEDELRQLRTLVDQKINRENR